MIDQYLVFPGADKPSSSSSSSVVVPPLSDRSEKLRQVLDFIPDLIDSDNDSDENDTAALVALQTLDSASADPLQSKVQLSELSDTLNNLDQLSFSLERLIVEKLDQLDAREIEINEELQEIRRLIDVGENLSYNKTSMSCFGMPYFKTNDLRPFPPNQDHLTKVANDELITYDLPMSNFWTANEIVSIQAAIAGEIIEKQMEKVSLILESTISNTIERKIEYKKAWSMWNNKPLSELVSSYDGHFDWHRIATYNFRDRHSPEECKRMWLLYARPSVIKTRWSKDEDTMLKQIAKERKYQDWETISQELNTGRSGYQCFVQYKRRLAPLKRVGKWTEEEDRLLSKIVDQCRIGAYIPWSKVMYYFENRSLRQLFNRWNYSLNPNLKKGHFTRSEDFGLCVGVQLYGKNFNKIASILGNRSSSQIRERYKSKMNEANTGSWSKEEDLQLLELFKKYGGKKWSQISKHLRRTRTQCRLRYSRLKDKYNFDLDVIRRNVKYKPFHLYEKAWFKQYFDSPRDEKTLRDVSRNLSMIKKKGRRNKSDTQVENQLINFFLESFTDPTTPFSRAVHVSNETKLDEAARAIISILKLFKANISFPKNVSESYIRHRDTSQIANDGLIDLILHVAKLYNLEESIAKCESFTVDNDNDFAENYEPDDNYDIDSEMSIEYDPSIVDPNTTKIKLSFMRSYNQASMTNIILGNLKEFYVEPKPEDHKFEQEDISTESNSLDFQHFSGKPSASKNHQNTVTTFSPKSKIQAEYLLPPNALSMIGLRTYMLARKKLWKMIDESKNDKKTQGKLLTPANHRKLSTKDASELAVSRFTSLLFWPLFLSSHGPSKLGFIKSTDDASSLKVTRNLSPPSDEDCRLKDEMLINHDKSTAEKEDSKNFVLKKKKATKVNKFCGKSLVDTVSKDDATAPSSSCSSTKKTSVSSGSVKSIKPDVTSNSEELLKSSDVVPVPSSSKTSSKRKRPAVLGIRRSARFKQIQLEDPLSEDVQ